MGPRRFLPFFGLRPRLFGMKLPSDAYKFPHGSAPNPTRQTSSNPHEQDVPFSYIGLTDPVAGEEITRDAQSTSKSPCRTRRSATGPRFLPNNVDGAFRVVTEFGQPVGTKGETAVRVVVGWDSRIWTAFPVKP